jgi:hypothetical protein
MWTSVASCRTPCSGTVKIVLRPGNVSVAAGIVILRAMAIEIRCKIPLSAILQCLHGHN